ncbi:MAG: Uma2 family endonuclease [Chthoniobacteraceae bacterium]
MATLTVASPSSTQRIRTRRDFEALGEGPPFYQLVEGQLYLMAAPNRFHQKIAANLFRALDREVHPNQLGEIYFAPFDVYFDFLNAHEPDLVFISKSQSHILTDAGAEGAPDLVVEILSPKSARLDRNKKRLVCARAGVQELWLVDPKTRTVEQWRLRDNPEFPARILRESDNQILTSKLLPRLRLPLREIFAQ